MDDLDEFDDVSRYRSAIRMCLLLIPGFLYFTIISPSLEDLKREPKSAEKSLIRQQKAAEQGNADAQAQLGEMYLKGEGVPRNYEAALSWYNKAAQRGSDYAQFKLGEMFSKGEGMPRDYYQSVVWYRKAAEQGNKFAQGNLGVMYREGQGVPRNDVLSYVWTSIAAANGHEGAQARLGDLEKSMATAQIEEAQREAKKMCEEIKRR